MDKMTLNKMIEELSKVEDITWGMYIFSRDILRDRISYEEKKEMIEKAIQCGYEKADEIIGRFASSNPYDIAAKLHLEIEMLDKGQMADRVLFALFTTPNLIQIMEEPVKKAIKHQEILDIISEEQIKSLILGHEIFHYIENEDETIYTRSKKIVLWNFLGYRHQSTVRALSEIAAMYFTKRLNSFFHSPLILDVLLYYSYNPNASEKICEEVLRFRKDY